MKQKLKATAYTCDAPECRIRFLSADGEELPYGFHGTVTYIGDWGGAGGEWFACTVNHIIAAIEAVIERSRS